MATLIVIPLHEFAHYVVARFGAGYWAEFLYSSVKYREAFETGEGILIVGAGLLLDIVRSVGLARFVWVKRASLTAYAMAVPIGISMLLIIPALVSLVVQPPNADLVKLSRLVLGGGFPGFTAVYGIYLLGVGLPTISWLKTYLEAEIRDPVNRLRLTLIVTGVLSGFGVAWAVREFLVAF